MLNIPGNYEAQLRKLMPAPARVPAAGPMPQMPHQVAPFPQPAPPPPMRSVLSPQSGGPPPMPSILQPAEDGEMPQMGPPMPSPPGLNLTPEQRIRKMLQDREGRVR